MKLYTSTAIAALAAGLLIAAPARAADLDRGGMKDDSSHDSFESPRTPNWGGWYITGALGVAKQDYESSRSIDREFGLYRNDKNGPDGIAGNADDTKEAVRYESGLFNHSIAEAFTFDGDNAIEGGAEISYKMQRGRFIIEPFVSANLSGSDAHGVEYDHTAKWTVAPPSTFGDIGASQLSSGDISVSKNWDANVGLKLGLLIAPNINLYGGGGLTYGDFDIKGGDVFKNGQVISGRKYPYAVDDNDGSFGWMAVVGAQIKQDRFVFGVQGEYRDFGSVGAGSTSTVSSGTATSASGNYSKTTGHDDVDATEWAVKGTLSYQLSD